MYLYGASGHAKVIIDILLSQGVSINGLFDDNPAIHDLLGYNVLGKYDPNILNDDRLIISIGSNKLRNKIAQSISARFGVALHKNSCISFNATIGEGTVVMHNSVIQSGSNIGKHVIINTGAVVEHDCVISDFAHIAPSATLCGNVQVDEGTLIGVGSSVIPGIKIGKWCIIGAGSVIVKNVPDYSLVYGNPGHIINN